MPHDPFGEEHRHFQDMLRRHREEIEAVRRHLNDVLKQAREEMKQATKDIRDMLAAARGLPPRPPSTGAGKRRRGGRQPDAGGVPVEPDNPRGLSGGAAAVPETEH